MRSLWTKELRGVRPFLVLILFLIFSSIILELLVDAPDLTDMGERLSFNEPKDVMIQSVFLFFMAFTMATGLLVREHDEGTQEFMDSLPVSRSKSFLVKAFTALTILVLLPLDTIIEHIILFRLTATSLDPPNHWPLMLTMALLEVCQIYVFVAVGFLLSFLRRFAWMVLPLLYFGYSYLHSEFPKIQYLNPFSLVDPVVSSNTLVFPFKHFAIQLLIGTICMALAWAMYLLSSDALHRLQTRLTKGTAGRLLLGFSVLLTGGLWITVIYLGVYSDEDIVSESKTWPEWETSQTLTQNFIFTHRGYQAGQARELAAVADTMDQQIRSFLGADKAQTKVVIDLTSNIPHLAGVAHWKKINIDLNSCSSSSERVAVMGHEMVHVYISQLSDSYLSRHFPSTQFFHEGLASYLEYRLFRQPEELADFRSVAAVAHQRTNIRIEELTNGPLLRTRLDESLVYNLGEVFVHALVETYGDEAPGAVLRAFGRKEALNDLEGETLWRDGFQAAGYSFDVVVARYFGELKTLATTYESLLTELPKLHASAYVGDNGKLVVDLEGDPFFDPWRAVCRFRQTVRDEDRIFIELDTGAVNVDAAYFSGNQAWYQLGWLDSENSRRCIYTEWRSTTIR